MLSLEQLKQITHGALRVWEEEGFFRFRRFAKAQAAYMHQCVRAPKEDASAPSCRCMGTNQRG